MDTASFIGFFKTIVYIVGFYYVFRFLAKLFLPILLKKAVQKAGENFQKQQQQHQNNYQNSTSANDFIFNKSTTSKPHETKKVGEYVDYEEIE